MNNRHIPLALSLALAATLVAGCNREPAVTTSAATPSTTSSTSSMSTDVADTMVTTKVKAALLGDSDVKGLDIKVETRKGLVMLSGFVDSRAQIDRAISITRAVEGVTNTENNMTVRNDQSTAGNTMDDGMVTAKVKTALLSNDGINSSDIAVVTNRGEVQLSGFVDNQAQVDQALVVARAVEGVHGVVNQMSIKK
jgi:hyperosmotically inducible periplasmic protein